jgi:hypothetical protein
MERVRQLVRGRVNPIGYQSELRLITNYVCSVTPGPFCLYLHALHLPDFLPATIRRRTPSTCPRHRSRPNNELRIQREAQHQSHRCSSGLSMQALCVSILGLYTRTHPSSQQVESISGAQSTPPASPECPFTSTPVCAVEPAARVALLTSNIKLLPETPEPPVASHRPHGLAASLI